MNATKPKTLCESCSCLLPSPYAKPRLAQFAVKCCTECKCYLCSDCASVHQPAHRIAELPVGSSSCCFHPGKPLYSFCVTHGVPCCSECVLDEKHRSCQIVPAQEGESAAETRAESIAEASERAGKALEALQDAYDDATQRRDELQRKIREFFSFVKDEVSRREAQMLTDVERCWDEKYDYSDLILQATERIDSVREAAGSGECAGPSAEGYVHVLRDICEKASQVEKRAFELEFSADNDEVKASIWALGSLGYHCGFKPCPAGTVANKRYAVSGVHSEVATKVEVNGCWSAAIGDTAVPRSGGAVKWAIRPVSVQDGLFMVGVAPANIDLNEDLPHMTCGWYFYCKDAMFYSNPYAHRRTTKYKKWSDAVKVSDEVGVVVDTGNRTISFVVANECLGPSYVDVPVDRPLVPAVCLYKINDSVKILTII